VPGCTAAPARAGDHRTRNRRADGRLHSFIAAAGGEAATVATSSKRVPAPSSKEEGAGRAAALERRALKPSEAVPEEALRPRSAPSRGLQCPPAAPPRTPRPWPRWGWRRPAFQVPGQLGRTSRAAGHMRASGAGSRLGLAFGVGIGCHADSVGRVALPLQRADGTTGRATGHSVARPSQPPSPSQPWLPTARIGSSAP
jgi:hypothetical protein